MAVKIANPKTAVPFTEMDTDSQVLTSWDDFKALNITKSMFSDAYKEKVGKGTKPDDVHLNDDFTMQYNWMSYNTVGETQVFDSNKKPMLNVGNQRTLVNKTNKAFTQIVKLSATQSKAAEVYVTQTSGVSTTATISIKANVFGVEIGEEFSTTFHVSNESGSKDTVSQSITISDQVEVTVPPNSQRTVKLEITWTAMKSQWKIPIDIQTDGRTGAQFPHKIDDHYFWSAVHSHLFPDKAPFQTYLTGEFDASYDIKGKTVVEDAKPI